MWGAVPENERQESPKMKVPSEGLSCSGRDPSPDTGGAHEPLRKRLFVLSVPHGPLVPGEPGVSGQTRARSWLLCKQKFPGGGTPSPSPSDDAPSRGPAGRWGARASQTAFVQTPPHVQRGSSRVLADSDNPRGDPMPCFGGRLVWPVAHGAHPSSSRSVRGTWSLGPKALMKGTREDQREAREAEQWERFKAPRGQALGTAQLVSTVSTVC